MICLAGLARENECGRRIPINRKQSDNYNYENNTKILDQRNCCAFFPVTRIHGAIH